MKKLFILFITFLIGLSTYAQTPESFKYQAVVRDASGAVISDQTVGVQIQILEGSEYGSAIYVETHSPSTNNFGLINFNIGEGSVQNGTFEAIDWGDYIYFVKVSIDISGGSSYTDMGTSQLLSVPYALQSKNTENYEESDPVFITHDVYGIQGTDITNWNSAYGWGDHSDIGYLTSFTETDPIFLTHDAYGVTVTGITNWNTAYGWGNHASAGYLTSFSETDPIFLTHDAYGVTGTGITNWNTAYGWGNHASAGYLTSFAETDPQVGSNTTHYIPKWNGTSLSSGAIVDYYGNIGIGTASPASRLHIKLPGTTSSSGLRMETSLTTYEDWFLYMNASDDFTFRNDASDYVTFQKNTGNVGIGTTYPTNKLHVVDDYRAVYGYVTSTGTHGYGVYGFSGGATSFNRGVSGYVNNSAGTNQAVYGNASYSGSNSNYGVVGTASYSTNINYGVYGAAYGPATHYAVFGQAQNSTDSYAGYFWGNLHSTGTNTKAADAIKIDHPLDPENKYLYLSSVESPDMLNLFNGNVILDTNGEASVSMPDWFEAVNMDFRYQLTAVGAPGPNLYIKEEIKNNQFIIAGGEPDMKVSWMVTGIRNDPFASKHRIKVEKDKPAHEKGKYMHPELYNQALEKGVDYENNKHATEGINRPEEGRNK